MLDANLHPHPCPLVRILGFFGTPWYHRHHLESHTRHIENVHGWKPMQTTLDSRGMLICPGGGSPYGNDEACPQNGCSGPLR